MRLLQVINSLDTGGAEKQLVELITRLEEQGIEVDLLVLNDNDFPLKKILSDNSNIKIFSFGNRMLYNPILIFRLIPFLKQYDILHVHLFPSLYWVSLSKMVSFSKTLLIYTEHNTSNRRRNVLFSFFDRLIYKKYHKIITISEEVDSMLKDHLKSSSTKFSMIKNGIDIHKIRSAAPIDLLEILKNKDRIIIQVASFTKQKDQKTLIRSIPHIKSPVSLLLVGKGPTMNECVQLAKDLGIDDKVHFLGIRMDVPSLLKSSYLVVLSTHFEGLSLSSIEGLASGKPFIASDAPGLSEIVDGAGILFPIGDENSLANKINNLLDDNDLYASISNSCMERSKDFDIEHTVKKHLELYRELCPYQN